MTSQDLKQLEDTLWQSADTLRANSDLKSTEYSTPVLGLIFLKFADNKYSRYEQEILVEHQKLQGTRREKPISEIALEKCGFYLAEGQGGGEFFTPRSVVRLLKVLDNKVRRLEKHHDISKATKPVKAELEQLHQELKDAEYFFTHIHWLHERFPHAKYEDVTGLCKRRATYKDIREQDYSFEEFAAEISALNDELNTLNAEAQTLEAVINHNVEQLVGSSTPTG